MADSQPDHVEVFENGSVGLEFHRWDKPMKVAYWITNGNMALQFTELEFDALAALVDAWLEERDGPRDNSHMLLPLTFAAWSVIALTIAALYLLFG